MVTTQSQIDIDNLPSKLAADVCLSGAKMVNKPIFLADNLSWQVGDKKILNQLDFSIQENSFVGIIGPNGAGKSSLLRCLFGKNQLTGGSLVYKSKSIENYSRRKIAQEISVVLQEPPTHFEMSIFDLVSMGLLPHKSLLAFSTNQEIDSVHRAIEKVELQDKIHQPFNTLSGGEKQRVMLARAIVQKSKVLILDEPTNHLDIQHQIEVLHLIKKMNNTVILSIHDLNMASAFCDRLILMNKGKIVCQGRCDEVLTQENLLEVFNVHATIEDKAFQTGPKISYHFDTDKLIRECQK